MAAGVVGVGVVGVVAVDTVKVKVAEAAVWLLVGCVRESGGGWW